MNILEDSLKSKYSKYRLIHEKRFQTIIQQLTSIRQEKGRDIKILDVGAHSLYLLSSLHALNFHQLYGIDVDTFINEIDKETKELLHLKVCDLHDASVPFEDNYFDVIVMSEVIEHLFFNPARCLMDLKRTLQPGGKLIITTPNVFRVANTVKMLTCKNIFALPSKGPSGHFKEYSLQDLEDFAYICNLKVTDAELKNLFRNPSKTVNFFMQLLSLVDPRRKDSIHITLQK
ncbi:class I SAM-dependent methyltransferase [bacterium]|nr:class I SAM-dependent methyltransferase [bacterium]